MTKKIVKVEETKKANKIDLNKIKDVIIDNKDTIAKIASIAGDLLDDNKSKKNTTKKTRASKSSKTKKNTKAKKSDLDTVLDLAGKFLK